MTKHEKKELFLYLIETWFSDTTDEINYNNCIGFYHYLLDCLDFELKFGPEPEPGFHRFLYVLIDFLHNFPNHREYIEADSSFLKNAILNGGFQVSESQFTEYLGYTKILYNNIKEEYFL